MLCYYSEVFFLTPLILQSTDMNSSRNIFVFGFSMFTALVIPNWILKNPDFFKTGTFHFFLTAFTSATTSWQETVEFFHFEKN